MTRKFYLLAAMCVLLFQNCTSVKLASNKQEGFNKKFNKVYVVINGAKDAKNFINEFSGTLKTKLAENKVESTVYTRNELSLDTEKDIDARITEYDPQALMVIKQTVLHSTSGGFGSKTIDGGTFEVSLIDGETKKVVWKANIEAYGSMGLSQSAESAVVKLCNKLKEDQVI